MPVLLALALAAGLLTRGKLRFVPTDSKDETEGRWRELLEALWIEKGRCMTELRRGCCWLASAAVVSSSAMGEMEPSLSLVALVAPRGADTSG
jgi:hypothetical protein